MHIYVYVSSIYGLSNCHYLIKPKILFFNVKFKKWSEPLPVSNKKMAARLEENQKCTRGELEGEILRMWECFISFVQAPTMTYSTV